MARDRMRRRRFLAASLAAIAAPRAAGAQQAGKTYRLAVLTRPGQGTDLTETAGLRYWRAWRDELQRLGYIEGKNLVVERLETEGEAQRIGELAGHMAIFRPDAIFTPAQNLAHALKAAGTTIPIVTIAVDPVGSGLVASLAQPGGNITGLSLDAGLEIAAKRIALLKEAVPTMSRMAFLNLRSYWEGRFGVVFRDAARQVGITAIGAPFDPPADEREFRRVFAAMVQDRADSLFITAQPEILVNRRLIAELAAEARLPAISQYREHVEAGGLMAYGADLNDIFRRLASYIDRILKGADPAGMPFQQPTRFELVINLKTANALGLTVPQSLLARADEVIE